MRPLVFDSTELRWFEPGRVPFDPIALDLGQGAPPAVLDERADVYCVSEDDGIGVKVRGDAGRKGGDWILISSPPEVLSLKNARAWGNKFPVPGFPCIPTRIG